MRHSSQISPEVSSRRADGFPERPSIPDVDVTAVRQQTLRILEDPLFRNSKRYTDLLRFIVDRTLRGQVDDLHERIIGIEVFGRAPDYDTSADPTVRVTATEIRKRLALYYTGADREHELRIEIPVRSYFAEFKPSKPLVEKTIVPVEEVVEPQPAVVVQTVPVEVPTPKGRGSKFWSIAALLLLAILLGAVALRKMLTAPSALETFWAPLTDDPGSIAICIGVSAHQTTLPADAPLTEEALHQADDLPPGRGLVPMLDVSAAFSLGRFLQRQNKEIAVVPANGTSLSDLRNGPVILVGSYDNEWTLRLGAGLPFKFQKRSDSSPRWIEDSANPSSQKWGLDIDVPQVRRDTDYGLVSRVLDPTTGHWWVGVGGLSGLGTYAAQQLVVDPKAFAKVAEQLPKGWSKKNTQIVLAVKAVHGSPGVPQVVDSRVW